MTTPDRCLDIVCKEHFGNGAIPRNHPGRKNEIADDNIVRFFLQQASETFPGFRTAILRDAVRLVGKQTHAVLEALRQTFLRRQLKRYTDDPIEHAFQYRMRVVGQSGVISKTRDCMPASELAKAVV